MSTSFIDVASRRESPADSQTAGTRNLAAIFLRSGTVADTLALTLWTRNRDVESPRGDVP